MSIDLGPEASELPPNKRAALQRADAHRAQAAEMRRLAEDTALEQRRRVLMNAAERFDALAELDEALVKSEPRSWAG